MSTPNEIRKFLLARSKISPAPAHYVLRCVDDPDFVTTVENDEEAAGRLEEELRAHLATVSGKTKYVLTAQDASGGVIASRPMPYLGSAGRQTEDGGGSVNAQLVTLVNKQSSFFMDHADRVIQHYKEAFTSVLTSNQELVRMHAEYGPDAPQDDPAKTMALGRIDALIGAMGPMVAQKLLGGGGGTAQPVKMGKYADLRAFIAQDLTDDELDAILSIALAADIGGQVTAALSPPNLAKAVKLMGGQ